MENVGGRVNADLAKIVERIKDRLPLENLISETVILKPAGKDRLRGLCPFHSETTPSFYVRTNKEDFKCYGCPEHGDLFDFVQKTQNLNFREALELLAARAGVELPERTKGRTSTPEERAERDRQAAEVQRELEVTRERKRLEKEEEEKRKVENGTAQHRVWEQLPKQGQSPYLKAKGLSHVNPFRYEGSTLVVPLWTASGTLATAQRIRPNGFKLYAKETNKKGAFTVVGGPDELDGKLDLHNPPSFMAEGVATAVRPHQAFNETSIAAYDWANIGEVVRAIRAAFDEAGMEEQKQAWLEQFVILADNDQWKDDGKNVGVEAAQKAALEFGCKVAVPNFDGLDVSDKPTDFDDLARLAGLDAVRAQLEAARAPDPDPLDLPTARTKTIYIGQGETLMRSAKETLGGSRACFMQAEVPPLLHEALRKTHERAKFIFVGQDTPELHRFGLEANVQIVTVRGERFSAPRDAAPKSAFADVSETAGYDRLVALGETFGAEIVTHEAGTKPAPLGPGVHALAMGKGFGKTVLAAQTVKANGGQTREVSHYRSLVGGGAQVYEATHYDDIDPRKAHEIENAFYCVNSLHKLLQKGQLSPIKNYVGEEWGQLLVRFTSNTDFARKPSCWAVHNHYAHTAENLTLTDAGPTEAAFRWLRGVRPNDPIKLHVSRTRTGLGYRIQPYTQRGGVRLSLQRALEHGENGWLAVDSVRQARRIAAWFRQKFPDLPILLVCRDTTGEPEVERFFRDPNAVSAEYRLIIASPTISTGVSIENGHFGWVGGEFGAQVRTPADAWQSLARVRGATLLHVWVNRARRRKASDQAAIWVELFGDPGANQDMFDLIDGKAVIRDKLYEQLYADVKREETEANNRYCFLFWRQAAEDGYEILSEFGEAADAALEVVNEAISIEHDDHAARLLDETPDKAAEEITDLMAELEGRSPTLSEQYVLERHDIKKMRALPDEPEREALAEAIAGDRRGAWRKAQRRLELAVSHEDYANRLAFRDLERAGREMFAIDGVDRELERELYRRVIDTFNVDPGTLEPKGDGFYDPNGDEALELIKWMAANHARLSHFVGVPDEIEGVKPGIIMRGLTRALDVKQKRRKKDGRWQYKIDLEHLARNRDLFAKRGILTSRTHNPVIEDKTPVCVLEASVPEVKPNHETAVTQPVNIPETAPTAYTAQSVPEPVVLPEPKLSPWTIPHYEGFRAFVREEAPGPVKSKMNELFSWADHGDPVAIADIRAYLQRADVLQLMGLTVPDPSGQAQAA